MKTTSKIFCVLILLAIAGIGCGGGGATTNDPANPSVGGGDGGGGGGTGGSTSKVATPTFNPIAGTYDENLSVTISTTTTGTTIYYTLDATAPSSTTGIQYTSPIALTEGSWTLKAIAIKSGMENSSISTATYSISIDSGLFTKNGYGIDDSVFEGVANAENAVYAVGSKLDRNYPLNLGNGVSATGNALGQNPLIVKYTSSGDTLWARLALSDTFNGASSFYGVSSSNSNIYAVGAIWTPDDVTFGNGVTIAGNADGEPMIVKYDINGNPQWANTITGGDHSFVARFDGVSVGADGVYIAGEIGWSYDPFDFGNGITVAGNTDGGGSLIAKYDIDGNAIWAKRDSNGDNSSYFKGIFASDEGVYAVGSIWGSKSFNFGNSVTTAGDESINVVIVKYNFSGEAQWAKSITGGGDRSNFNGVSVDDTGVYAVGSIFGAGTFDFGNGVTVAGTTAGENLIIVKYDLAGNTKWAKTVTGIDDSSYYNGVSADNDGIYAVGIIQWSTAGSDFGNGVSAVGGHSVDNAIAVKYNSDGEAQWARTAVDYSSCYFKGVSSGLEGVYVVGKMWGSSDYNCGNDIVVSSSYQVSSSGAVLISKFNK